MEVVKIKNKEFNILGFNNEYITPLSSWDGIEKFIAKIQTIEIILYNTNNFFKTISQECSLCENKDIGNGLYKYNNFIWNSTLLHYIRYHYYKPPDQFILFIKKLEVKNKIKNIIIKYNSRRYIVNSISYIKIKKNQLNILDALLEHGGKSKKYFKNKKLKYSEHSGLLDFTNNGLEKIVISGIITRIEKRDSQIFFPENMDNALEYEYIFHTHPATPTPGFRARYGILYDWPSVDDLLHFLDHFHNGITQGSLVIASEGLYNIRKLHFDRIRVNLSERSFIKKINNLYEKVQYKAIKKYGTKFSKETFYSKIAQDYLFIDEINKTLNEHQLHIDYFPRKKIKTLWVLDTIYLPIYVIKKLRTASRV